MEKRIQHSLHVRMRLTPVVRGAMFALLLLAVPMLATLAKNSWYLPQSNPGHYLNIASKMQVRPCPIVLEKTPLHTIAKLGPQRPVTRITWANDVETPKTTIGVTVSLQHRSPPVLYS